MMLVNGGFGFGHVILGLAFVFRGFSVSSERDFYRGRHTQVWMLKFFLLLGFVSVCCWIIDDLERLRDCAQGSDFSLDCNNCSCLIVDLWQEIAYFLDMDDFEKLLIWDSDEGDSSSTCTLPSLENSLTCGQVSGGKKSDEKCGSVGQDWDSADESELVAASQKAEEAYRKTDEYWSGECGKFALDYSDISDCEDSGARFSKPLADEDVEKLLKKDIPKNTGKTVQWAVNLYDQWRIARNCSIVKDDTLREVMKVLPSRLESQSVEEINYGISRFVHEIKRVDGGDYPPKTIRQIVLLLQMHLIEHGKNFRLLMGKHFLISEIVLTAV